MKADLHMHTIHSDGDYVVSEVIKQAKLAKLDVISITDHDSLKGAREALSSKDQDIKIIPGIELSTSFDGESVHVLGYFKELPDINSDLEVFLKTQKEIRDERARKMASLILEHFNIDLNVEDILDKSTGIITRGHMARSIIKKYPNYTTNMLFDTVLHNDSIAYIPSTKISTKEGIALLRASHAIVVIAHPGIYRKCVGMKLFDLNPDGIEVNYRSHTPALRALLHDQIKSRHMIFTAGSDFHGEVTKNHGLIGDEVIDGEDLKRFLNLIDNIKK